MGHSDDLGRALDALYWLRRVERDVTELAERLARQDALPLSVDQRLENMRTNRQRIMTAMDGNYLPMTAGQQFAEAVRYVAQGLDPLGVAVALQEVVGRSATLPDWIHALGSRAYAGEGKQPNPFEQGQPKFFDRHR
ncbi:hypothetical protein BXT84_00455 [Sulfobacillus thermotolerans]|uniref:Uncharacterized protein n=1 Tax=Sulfobacillus thermotolerans TaxID=338644 RepID=A0ABN5GVY7_9FIRM|nr:hypothetical protein BXT84_00455 [Sulfobacillus thermotolerans]